MSVHTLKLKIRLPPTSFVNISGPVLLKKVLHTKLDIYTFLTYISVKAIVINDSFQDFILIIEKNK